MLVCLEDSQIPISDLTKLALLSPGRIWKTSSGKCMSVFLLECSDFLGSKISSGRQGGGKGGSLTSKRLVDVKRGKSEYVDGPQVPISEYRRIIGIINPIMN